MEETDGTAADDRETVAGVFVDVMRALQRLTADESRARVIRAVAILFEVEDEAKP